MDILAKDERLKTGSVVKELKRIYRANGKLLLPEKVLDEARNPDSALHSYFEWDDTAAAEKFRIEQARRLIIRYSVKMEPEKPAARIFYSLTTDRAAGGGYRTVPDILKTHPAEARKSALDELSNWCKRYEPLCEDVVSAVRKAVAKFQ